ncbi:hypothetical protein [Pseudomonas savastanoi]|uniref:Uncharacterized protein n=1 Tax=Pseudomonas savastanoi pv. nerii TaxID=360921 RepID=A0AB74BJB6_PSESS|nr:hypothetical protein [Pseudomonas savastanoi]KAA3532967.1 hypothetical protein DXU85_27945 [Pseudomonas savastanoi]KPB11628.1 hypothetical protein AC519_2172 [Pseudomonas savastanoi]KPY64983.1 hypothetical protein ALO58_200197 [Pseudomonas savastanoi pv. savastanoi]RML77145.1 hypothetical protein ALQ90_200084 [Pseudomonas savastanoi pv. savastanoi]RML98883.1 hypothetical protein ALQ88_200026 [Pseudomonas savastanoi]
MSQTEKAPATARDALITELLSDVGRLHDDIKSIPKTLELSMRDSIDIVADAVEDAEDTALWLQEETKALIQATTTKAGLDVGIKLSEAIHESLGRVFEPALNRATVKIEQLENRLSALSGNIRDTQATRFNYMMLAGLIMLAAIMLGGMTWLAIESQDVNEVNKWFYDEYKAQNNLLNNIPAAIKEKYKK